jgi:2-polyprenyl-6-methoxyphenol hydroxylase-like FAD-dependent oxidoreductase
MDTEIQINGMAHVILCVSDYPMVDRDPVERWSFGRVTLLGDAAHPMYPVGSNGAAQGILDAEALAAALVEGDGDVVSALARYKAARLPATAAVVLSNRQFAPSASCSWWRIAFAGPRTMSSPSSRGRSWTT